MKIQAAKRRAEETTKTLLQTQKDNIAEETEVEALIHQREGSSDLACQRKLKVGATVKCMFEEGGVVEWLCGTGNAALLAPCNPVIQYGRYQKRHPYTST